MSRFLQKPIVVQAKQWFEPGHAQHDPTMLTHRKGNSVNPPDYRQAGDLYLACPGGPPLGGSDVYMLKTLQGDMRVSSGDWIITGDKGEKRACRPDVFEATHKPIPHLNMVCGVDCHPGDAVCNNYCNEAPQKGPMAPVPPLGPDAPPTVK